MKDIISRRGISVLSPVIIFVLFITSVAFINLAAADRLTENPDIHDAREWQLWHGQQNQGSIGAWVDRGREIALNQCVARCREESFTCERKYNAIRPGDQNQIQSDCYWLFSQCSIQECERYECEVIRARGGHC